MDLRKYIIGLTLAIGVLLGGTAAYVHAQDDFGGEVVETLGNPKNMSAAERQEYMKQQMERIKAQQTEGGKYQEVLKAGQLKIWQKFIVSFGWVLITTIGFSIGIGFALFVFDLITTDIEEWKEIASGNIPVAIVFASIILSIGIIVYNVI